MNFNYKILLVDDSTTNLAHLEELILSHININILQATSANTALDILSKEQVDLIISDVTMPDIDGFGLVKLLKQKPHTRDIPIIFISAIQVDDKFVKKGYSLGVLDYLTKPISEYLLISKLKTYIDLFIAKKELEEKNNYVTSLLESSDEILVVIDDTQKILDFNAKAFDLFFGSIQKNKKLHQLFEESKESYKLIETYLSDVDLQIFPLNIILEKRNYKVTYKKLHQNYLLTLLDITDQILANEERALLEVNNKNLAYSNQALKENLSKKDESLESFKHEFIALFTHELKTPLNAIINFSEYLLRMLEKKDLNKSSEAKIKKFLQKIYTNGRTQEEMINTLLRFAQVKSGKLEVNKIYIDINKVLLPIVTQLNELYDKEVIVDIPKDTFTYIDPKICAMIFSNLYSNALKYSNSKVKISARKDEKLFQLIIEDDGDGISEENKERVFGFFEQSQQNSVIKMEKKGTGIGLYTVKLLADICEKNIRLEESDLGGARFIIEGPSDEQKNY